MYRYWAYIHTNRTLVINPDDKSVGFSFETAKEQVAAYHPDIFLLCPLIYESPYNVVSEDAKKYFETHLYSIDCVAYTKKQSNGETITKWLTAEEAATISSNKIRTQDITANRFTKLDL